MWENWCCDVMDKKMAVAPQLVDISKHEFKEPQRLVKVPEDMDKWFTCQVGCLHARLCRACDNCGNINLNPCMRYAWKS